MNKIDRYKILVRYAVSNGIVPSQKGLGRMMGYSNESSFSQILNGKVEQPKDFINRLTSIIPDLNEDWIENNNGEMLKTEQKAENNSTNNSGVNIQAGGNVDNNRISMDNDRMKDEIIALLKDKTALQNEIIAGKNRDIKELTEQCAQLLNELTKDK